MTQFPLGTGPREEPTAFTAWRALGMLIRKGYELELAHDAIRQHVGAPAYD